MMKVNQWLFVALILSFSAGTWAQDEDWGDDWGEEETKPYTLSGFIETGFGQFLQTNIVKNEQSLAELRARIDGVYEFKQFTINAKGDLISDKVTSGLDWSTRKLNIAGSLTSAIDFKIGRQVLTWGTGDYLFLNFVHF